MITHEKTMPCSKKQDCSAHLEIRHRQVVHKPATASNGGAGVGGCQNSIIIIQFRKVILVCSILLSR